jgi:predicted ATPase
MITEISIEDIKHYKVGDDNKTSLPNLSRVNIFVGPNNSGKSYFMRSLFGINRIKYRQGDNDVISNVNSQIHFIKRKNK